MLCEFFYETGITVLAGVLTANVRIDHIIIDLGRGEDCLGTDFFYDHKIHVIHFAFRSDISQWPGIARYLMKSNCEMKM